MSKFNVIEFSFECWPPFDVVTVIANEDGKGILIIDKATDNEIQFDDLAASDRARILAMVKEYVDYYKDMEQSDPFGSVQYIRGLNEDMDKK